MRIDFENKIIYSHLYSESQLNSKFYSEVKSAFDTFEGVLYSYPFKVYEDPYIDGKFMVKVINGWILQFKDVYIEKFVIDKSEDIYI